MKKNLTLLLIALLLSSCSTTRIYDHQYGEVKTSIEDIYSEGIKWKKKYLADPKNNRRKSYYIEWSENKDGSEYYLREDKWLEKLTSHVTEIDLKRINTDKSKVGVICYTSSLFENSRNKNREAEIHNKIEKHLKHKERNNR